MLFRSVQGTLAEREGFEPPVRLPARRISSAVLSTTQPPLRQPDRRVHHATGRLWARHQWSWRVSAVLCLGIADGPMDHRQFVWRPGVLRWLAQHGLPGRSAVLRAGFAHGKTPFSQMMAQCRLRRCRGGPAACLYSPAVDILAASRHVSHRISGFHAKV